MQHYVRRVLLLLQPATPRRPQFLFSLSLYTERNWKFNYEIYIFFQIVLKLLVQS